MIWIFSIKLSLWGPNGLWTRAIHVYNACASKYIFMSFANPIDDNTDTVCVCSWWSSIRIFKTCSRSWEDASNTSNTASVCQNNAFQSCTSPNIQRSCDFENECQTVFWVSRQFHCKVFLQSLDSDYRWHNAVRARESKTYQWEQLFSYFVPNDFHNIVVSQARGWIS